MAEITSPSAGLFEREATQVLSEVRKLLDAMLAKLGVRRPIELQRLLNLDATLSWQISKVAGDGDVLSEGAAMPSRGSLDKFTAGAARHGVEADQIELLADAYGRFERLVKKHAGDRTTFNSLVTAAGGLSDEWVAADLQHRRNMYRGQSHAMGVQARTRLMAFVLAPDAGTGLYEMAVLNGYVNVRTLRALDRIRVYGARLQVTEADPENAVVRWQPVEARDNFLFERFTSRPLPRLEFKSGTDGAERWAETALVRPEIGNVGTATVMFGERCTLRALPTHFERLNTLPTEVSILDLIVPPGLLDGPPASSVFFGHPQPADRQPDVLPVLGDAAVERLGVGADVLETPDVPEYVEMARAAARAMAINLTAHEVWRLRIEYPLYQSTARLTCRYRPAATK